MLKQLALKGKIKPDMLLRKGQSGQLGPGEPLERALARTYDGQNAGASAAAAAISATRSYAAGSCAAGGPTGSRARYARR